MRVVQRLNQFKDNADAGQTLKRIRTVLALGVNRRIDIRDVLR